MRFCRNKVFLVHGEIAVSRSGLGVPHGCWYVLETLGRGAEPLPILALVGRWCLFPVVFRSRKAQWTVAGEEKLLSDD